MAKDKFIPKNLNTTKQQQKLLLQKSWKSVNYSGKRKGFYVREEK